MTGSLDDMLTATASHVTRPHDEEETTALTLTTADGEDIDVDATTLESEIAGVESVLTSPEFLSILDKAMEVGSGSEVADKDRLQGWLTQWLETVDSSLEDVKADIVRFVSLIRDELIPAIAAMRGTLEELEQARAASGYAGTQPPGEPGGSSAAYNSLNSVTSPTTHPGAHHVNGYQPGSFAANQQPWNAVDTTPVQWAYDTLGTLPQKMEGLVQGNYAPSPRGYVPAQGSGWHPATTTTSSGGYAAVAPHTPVQQPMAAPSGGQAPSGGGGYSPMSPAAQLMSRQGRGGSGGSSPRRQSSTSSRRSSGGSSRSARAGMPSRRGGGGSSNGVTKAELQRMIADAKRRIAAERGPQRPGMSPRSLPTRRSVPSTLANTNNGSSSGSGASKPKFVDMSATAPPVARPDSETSSAKTPTPPSSGGGGGGGRGGMGMMPMGGMMGAMNRAGQGGPGGGPGGGGSSVEVPTDYDLSKVGKRQDAVAGGVVKPGLVTIDDIDPNEMYVSPVQRAPEDPEGEGDGENKGPKKRGLGNIFG